MCNGTCVWVKTLDFSIRSRKQVIAYWLVLEAWGASLCSPALLFLNSIRPDLFLKSAKHKQSLLLLLCNPVHVLLWTCNSSMFLLLLHPSSHLTKWKDTKRHDLFLLIHRYIRQSIAKVFNGIIFLINFLDLWNLT